MEAVNPWAANILFFSLFMTAAGSLLPSGKYEKYLRLFSGMVLILLLGVAMVIHAFSADRTPEEFRLREITEEEHSDARKFIGELTGYARKGAAANFARHCEDARNRKTASSWYTMRKFSSAESKLTGISSYEADPERCRLHGFLKQR